MYRRAVFSALLLAALGLAAPVHASTNQSPTRQFPQAPAGWPQRIQIGSIGVNAPILPVTLYKNVSLSTVPWQHVGWWSPGAKPGLPGRAFIVGHLDSTTGPDVFWHLGSVSKGQTISVQYKKGATVTFVVQWTHTYDVDKVPMKWVVQHTRMPELVLLTCAGVFTPGPGYNQRLLVYAEEQRAR